MLREPKGEPVAKIRIYEIAKLLNIENKELVQRLNEMGLEVKTASSSIDEEDFKRVRSRLEGKAEEVVVERRVKSTVIRRRVKIVETKPEEGEEQPVEPEEQETEPAPHPEEEPLAPEPSETDLSETAPPQVEVPEPIEAIPEEEKEKTPAPTPRKEARETAPLPKPPPAAKTAPATTPPRKPVSRKPPPPTREAPFVKEAPKPPSPAREREEKTKPSKSKRRRRTPPVEDEGSFRRRIFLRGSEEILGTESGERTELPRVIRPITPRKKPPPKKGIKKPVITVPKAIKRVIKIHGEIGVGEFARRMGIKSAEVIKNLMELGVMATINQNIDRDTAAIVAEKHNHTVEDVSFREEDVFQEEVQDSNLILRPPVVTVMGHVDHGKTLLLDAIRETRLVDREVGGITQHIGAYRVELPEGAITFLDTPGHEAFTAMRARGAQVTDIVVLVVAADDGVMPQTIEAINHARAAGVTIIVAINKTDKPDADPERVRRQLSDHELHWEGWGGDTVMVDVSAKTRKGVKELLEYILIQAELLELKADPSRMAAGVVVEARLDKGRGPVATVLIKEGTLRIGEAVLAGVHSGKVRAMINDEGARMEKADPSTPVEIVGLSGVPGAGDIIRAVSEESLAKQVGEFRQEKLRGEVKTLNGKQVYLDWQQRIIEGEAKTLRLILKADVQGSVEALSESLKGLSNDSVKVEIIHAATGNITESDVMLAAASRAMVVGFSVRAEAKAKTLAEKEKVRVRLYRIIYEALEEIQAARDGLLEPKYRQEVTGRAEILEVFPISRAGNVAGSYVKSGKISRGSMARLIRGSEVIYEGKIVSLRRFKEDVREVSSDFECGIRIENCEDMQSGDIIESYELVQE